MAKKETVNTAEAYRKERRERIAKANKKNAKGAGKRNAAAKFTKKVVALVIVAAIIIGVGYKVITTIGVAEKLATAMKIGDTKITVADFNYYYSTMYQQTSYYAQYYQQYGMDMGFKTDVSPDDPSNTTTDADGNSITWADSFLESAKQRAQYVAAYYSEAVKAGVVLTDDEKAEIDETIENYRSSAEENGYSLNAYLKSCFCPGFTEKKFRALLEMDTLASSYNAKKQEDLTAAVSEDKIKTEYDKNGKDYDYIDVVYYSVAKETLTGNDGETEKDLKKRQDASDKEMKGYADGIYAKVTDADSFNAAAKAYEDEKAAKAEEEAKAENTEETAEASTEETAEETEVAEEEEVDVTTTVKHTTYSAMTSAISEDAAKWLFDSSRKAGDKKLFNAEGAYYIVLVTKSRYTSNSVDVRSLLVAFETDENGEATDEAKKAAKKTAEDLLKDWKSGKKTEETFVALINDNGSDDGTEDGLYKAVRITDSQEEKFIEWCFSNHKVGDTGIIETSTGYQILYFSANNKDDLDWKDTIRTKFGNEDFEKSEEDLLAEDGEYKIEEKVFWTEYVKNQFCSKIAKNLAYSA